MKVWDAGMAPYVPVPVPGSLSLQNTGTLRTAHPVVCFVSISPPLDKVGHFQRYEPLHCIHKTENNVFVTITVISCWSAPRIIVTSALTCKMHASLHNTCPSELAIGQHRYDWYSTCSPLCFVCTPHSMKIIQLLHYIVLEWCKYSFCSTFSRRIATASTPPVCIKLTQTWPYPIPTSRSIVVLK